jgi:hypothetical protein
MSIGHPTRRKHALQLGSVMSLLAIGRPSSRSLSSPLGRLERTNIEYSKRLIQIIN